jgi:hypothetical protein
MAHSNARRKLIRLIQKYMRGKASPEEEQFIEAYYESFDSSGEQPQLQADEEKALLAQEMKAAIWQKIDAAEQAPLHIPVVKRSSHFFFFATMAVLYPMFSAIASMVKF